MKAHEPIRLLLRGCICSTTLPVPPLEGRAERSTTLSAILRPRARALVYADGRFQQPREPACEPSRGYRQAQNDLRFSRHSKKYKPLEQEVELRAGEDGRRDSRSDYLRRVYDKYVPGVNNLSRRQPAEVVILRPRHPAANVESPPQEPRGDGGIPLSERAARVWPGIRSKYLCLRT